MVHVRNLVSLLVVVLVLAFGVGGLFWVQNSSRTTQLSLDLWFAAWQLSEPVAVPTLIAVSFGAGLLVGAGLLAIPSARNARRARRLEAELAMSGVAPRDGWRA